MKRTRLHELAQLGAKARLQEINTERSELIRLFDLKGQAPKRRSMSAAARAEVSRRMTKYWRERRKAGN